MGFSLKPTSELGVPTWLRRNPPTGCHSARPAPPVPGFEHSRRTGAPSSGLRDRGRSWRLASKSSPTSRAGNVRTSRGRQETETTGESGPKRWRCHLRKKWWKSWEILWATWIQGTKIRNQMCCWAERRPTREGARMPIPSERSNGTIITKTHEDMLVQ